MKKLTLMVMTSALVFSIAFTLCYGATQAPQKGGILKIIVAGGGGPTNIGYPPTQAGAKDFGAALPCIESLLRHDDLGRPTPLLATGWQIAQDGKSITFTLRKDVKFHDGTDFNADAVKYNLDARMKARPVDFFGVQSIDVVDSHTVRLNLTQFSNALLTRLAFSAGMIASPTFLKTKDEQGAKFNPVGTGPFKFVSFDRDASVKYEKFKDYWDKGKPYLDGLEFQYIADMVTAIAAFQAGQAQVFDGVDSQDVSRLQGMGFQILYRDAGIQAFVADSAQPDSIYAKKQVREAMEYGIDKQGISKAFGYGLWKGLNQLCPPGFMGYNADYKGRPYDPEKAKQLLAEAGYPNGIKTKMIAFPLPVYKEVMPVIQNNFKKAGIEVELDFPDYARWGNYRSNGWNNALLQMLYGLGQNYTESLHTTLVSTSKMYTSMARPAGWDDLLNTAITSKDYDTQKALTEKAVRLAADEAMAIPLFSVPLINALHKSVNDTHHHKWNHMLWTPADAWLIK